MGLARSRAWLLSAGILAACGSDGGDKSTPEDDGGAEVDGGKGDGGKGDAGKPDGGQSGESWTVFMYGHGDHNLSNSLVRDIAEMAQAQLSADVQVVVLADFDAQQTIADGSGDTFPSGAHWLQVEGGGAEPVEIQTDAELDFDDPQTLADAVATALGNFPADHYAVILWDHGGSWSGGFGGDTQDGTREGSAMSAKQVASAIRAGMTGAEVDGPLDIFAFDTCLMASAEVATEFKALAQVYIADAEIDYGDGWDYTGFLTYLSQHPGEDVRALAKREVALWDAHHLNAGDNDRLLRSHVAIDLGALGAFDSAFAKVSDAWLESELSIAPQLGRAAYFSLPPYMNQLSAPGDAPELRDVGQFLQALSAGVGNPALASAATAAKSALEAAILASSQGELRSTAGQLGFHVELPLATNMSNELLDSYKLIAATWTKATSWDQALRGYGALDDATGPQITSSISNGEGPTDQLLPTIRLQSPDLDVAEAEVNLGLVDPEGTGQSDELLFYGVVAKGAIDAGDSYDITWNGKLLTLPDGKGGQQPIFVRTWEDVGTAADAQAPAAALLATFGQVDTSDGQSALGALLFQDGDANTGLLALFDPAITLSLAEVASDLPGSTFTPILESITISSGVEAAYVGAPIPLSSGSLPLAMSSAPVANYALLTSVSDVFGNVDSDLQLVHITTPIE
jgi:hypothetical protein